LFPCKFDKLLIRLLSGASDTNIAFDDLRKLLVRFGFNERIRGDHHIYTKDGIEEILNLQPLGTKAKPYQVKQVRAVIVRYKLGVSDVE
jgi:virulence-associated protein VapD